MLSSQVKLQPTDGDKTIRVLKIDSHQINMTLQDSSHLYPLATSSCSIHHYRLQSFVNRKHGQDIYVWTQYYYSY